MPRSTFEVSRFSRFIGLVQTRKIFKLWRCVQALAPNNRGFGRARQGTMLFRPRKQGVARAVQKLPAGSAAIGTMDGLRIENQSCQACRPCHRHVEAVWWWVSSHFSVNATMTSWLFSRTEAFMSAFGFDFVQIRSQGSRQAFSFWTKSTPSSPRTRKQCWSSGQARSLMQHAHTDCSAFFGCRIICLRHSDMITCVEANHQSLSLHQFHTHAHVLSS